MSEDKIERRGSHPNSRSNLKPPWTGKHPDQYKGGKGGKNLWLTIHNLLGKEVPEMLDLLDEKERVAVKAILSMRQAHKRLTIKHILAAVGMVKATKGDFKFWKEIMDRHAGAIVHQVIAEHTHRSDLETMSEEELRALDRQLTEKLADLDGGTDNED